MPNLIQTMEATAARGAEGLTSEARETLALALRALQCPDGGFAGLDGRSDLYYSFFAWLALRALGVPFDRERLCAYTATKRCTAKGVDVRCAEILLVRENRRMRCAGWLTIAGALFRGAFRDLYGAFLLALLADALLPHGVPCWAALRAWRRVAARDWGRLPTPQLAAGLVLATLAGERGASLTSALEGRRHLSGGFVSSAGASPDLLATAVASFALWLGCHAREGHATQKDLAFIEACWLEDGLFGASPADLHGDAENTFYGLLALGTCRLAEFRNEED